MKIAITLSFLLMNFFFPQKVKREFKTYVITHESAFDWDAKNKAFEKYTGWWPPENTQIKGVEESVLEVSSDKIELKKYYHHAYCSELRQTFVIKPANKISKLLELSAVYTEDGVYSDCDGIHEVFLGSATIKSNDISFEDLMKGNAKEGSIITIWYFIPSKKEGIKMAIKIKKR